MRNAVSFLVVLLSSCAATPLAPPPAASAPATYDECGPAIQTPGTPDTCNTAVTLRTAPAPYKVLLTNDGSSLNITYRNCLPVILDVCATLTSPLTPVGQWNWSDAGSGCTMGFWLPQYNGSAERPTVGACKNNVFTPMYNIGQIRGGTAYNQVTVNLAKLPDDFQTGEAVNVGYPSYTLTYLPLVAGPQTPLVV